MKKAIAFVFSVLIFWGLTVVPASAKAGDLVIRNSSSSQSYLLVCKDWTGTTCAGSYYYLWPGKNTKDAFGWVDADAVLLTSSKRYYVSTNNWSVYNGCGGKNVEVKRPGSAYGSTVETWTVYKC